MTNTRSNGLVVLTKHGNRFTGHQLGTLAAAIQAELRFGQTPMTFDEIISNTRNLAREIGIADHPARARGHMAFWHHLDRDPQGKRHVYLNSNGRWSINPDAIYNPEWQGATSAEAKRWYDQRYRGW